MLVLDDVADEVLPYAVVFRADLVTAAPRRQSLGDSASSKAGGAGKSHGGGSAGSEAAGAAGSLGDAGASDTGGGGGTDGSLGGSSGALGTAGSSAGSGGTAGVASGGMSASGGISGAAGSGGGSAGTAGTGGAAGSGGSSAGTAGIGGSAGTSGAAGSAGAGGSGGAVPTCGADGVACTTNSGKGVCSSQLCVACSSDPECVTGYGPNNLCLSGSCTPGDCRANPDCASNPGGSICGATQPNFCGKCTSDTQCGAQICDTTSGQCVANSCSTTGNACSQNASDVCCTASCFPGTCCADATCKTTLGPSAVCTNHTCTTCDAVAGANPVYLVDPINGDDGSATGSGTSSGGTTATASCSFATLTRALQAIGPNPASGTIVKIVGASTIPYVANTKAIAEVFPIVVPSQVTITASKGLVTMNPPASSVAFKLGASSSGIDGTAGGGTLIIDGQAHGAFIGVHVGNGSTDGTFLRNVTIRNFLKEGILVSDAGALGIKQGVSVLSNGLGSGKGPGLLITGSAHANINVPDGQATTAFNNNGQHGILVTGTGSVNIQGAHSASAGTIECKQNDVAGLAISQTPGASLPPNIVNGLLVLGTANGNGIRIEGGSNVTITNSATLGNAGSGLLVTTSLVGNTRNNSIANINLGTSAAPGGNAFQASLGNNANQGAGICLQLDANSGTLMARGNQFSGGADCKNSASVLTFSNQNCGNNRDLGLLSSKTTTAGNNIDVSLCTHP